VDPHDARRSIPVGHKVGVVHDHSMHRFGSEDLVAQDLAR